MSAVTTFARNSMLPSASHAETHVLGRREYSSDREALRQIAQELCEPFTGEGYHDLDPYRSLAQELVNIGRMTEAEAAGFWEQNLTESSKMGLCRCSVPVKVGKPCLFRRLLLRGEGGLVVGWTIEGKKGRDKNKNP